MQASALFAHQAVIDAIFDGDDFHVMGVMEHIEPAGIHSGDSNAVLPAFNLTPLIVHPMEEYAEKIARSIKIKMPSGLTAFEIFENKNYLLKYILLSLYS